MPEQLDNYGHQQSGRPLARNILKQLVGGLVKSILCSASSYRTWVVSGARRYQHPSSGCDVAASCGRSGDGWSSAGYSATDTSPVNPGEALLIAEGGIPQRIKAAYLSDADIRALADYAAWTRRTHRLTTTTGPATAVA